MIARGHVAALALPIVFASAVLASAALNRRDGRGPTVLSEREVSIALRSEDRSVSELSVSWSEPAGPVGAWLTRSTLEALGFDLSVPAAAPGARVHYERQLSRRAYVALELDGAAWQAVLDARAAAAGAAPLGMPPPPDGLRTYGSRLVPVAVDGDAQVLARRFPDPQRHLITRAIIGVRRYELPGGEPYIAGAVINLDPQRIQMPADEAQDLPVAPFRGGEAPPPFRVSLMYGRRWEPWVAGVSRGDASR